MIVCALMSAVTIANIEMWMAGAAAAISLYTGTKLPKKRKRL